jgi:hypothetical protein
MISLLLNVLAISPELLWRDARFAGWRRAFWFHASGAHRRICGFSRF